MAPRFLVIIRELCRDVSPNGPRMLFPLFAQQAASVLGLARPSYVSCDGTTNDVLGGGRIVLTLPLLPHRAMAAPGESWRVGVLAPTAAAEAEALQDPGLAAALLARRTVPAILQVGGWASCALHGVNAHAPRRR